MYCLNKIIGFLTSPIGVAIAGGLVAFACARLGRKRLGMLVGMLTVAWLWLWMTPIMTFMVGVPLERDFLKDGKVPIVETFPEAEAIVLLGGSMGIETSLSSYAEMSGCADRVWQTARLYKAGKAPRVIATGNHAKNTTLQLLKEFGISEDSVSFLDARTTEEEAKALAEIGCERILLVTSAWHMKRARLMFEKYAPSIEVACSPADYENTFMARRTPFFKALLPDPNVFMLNSVSFHEWVGIIGYTLFR